MSLVVLGLASYMQLGVDIFPNVDLPTITITTRPAFEPTNCDQSSSFNSSSAPTNSAA